MKAHYHMGDYSYVFHGASSYTWTCVEILTALMWRVLESLIVLVSKTYSNWQLISQWTTFNERFRRFSFATKMAALLFPQCWSRVFIFGPTLVCSLGVGSFSLSLAFATRWAAFSHTVRPTLFSSPLLPWKFVACRLGVATCSQDLHLKAFLGKLYLFFYIYLLPSYLLA